MIRGLIRDSSACDRPSASSVPGLKFASTTSACRTRSRKSRPPASLRRSRPRPRLLRCPHAKEAFIPPPRRVWRSPSGKAEFSTLITSAPWSASSRPSSAPNTITPRSRTRRPDSGPPSSPSPRPRTGGSGRDASAAASCCPGSGARRSPARVPSTRTYPDGTRARMPPASSASTSVPASRKWSAVSTSAGLSSPATGTPRRAPSATRSAPLWPANSAAHQRVEPVGGREPDRNRVVARISELRWRAEPVEHRAPLPGGQQAQPDMAVRAPEHRIKVRRVRAAAREGFRPPGRRRALGAEAGIEAVHHGFQRADVHVLASPGAQPLDVCDQRGPGGVHRHRVPDQPGRREASAQRPADPSGTARRRARPAPARSPGSRGTARSGRNRSPRLRPAWVVPAGGRPGSVRAAPWPPSWTTRPGCPRSPPAAAAPPGLPRHPDRAARSPCSRCAARTRPDRRGRASRLAARRGSPAPRGLPGSARSAARPHQ